jgi:hypothetical protein
MLGCSCAAAVCRRFVDAGGSTFEADDITVTAPPGRQLLQCRSPACPAPSASAECCARAAHQALAAVPRRTDLGARPGAGPLGHAHPAEVGRRRPHGRGHNAQRGRGGLNRSWQQLDREGRGGWERRGCRNWPLTPSRHSRRAACGDPALRRHGRHWAPTEDDIPLAYAPLDAPTTLRRPCSSTAWVSTPRAPPAVVPGPVSRGVAGCDGPFRTRRPHPERGTAVARRRAHRRLRGHRVLRRRHVCLPLLSCPSTCGRAATRAGRRTLGSWSRPTR